MSPLDLTFLWYKFKLLFFCIYLPYYASSTCPDDVKGHTKTCFREYEMKIRGILAPQNTIISGVDAENIRLLCTAFKSGLSCVADLKSSCTQDTAVIDEELGKLPLAVAELNKLCRDDSFYEVYARNRVCYEKSGVANERCFKEVMNSSVRIITELDPSSVTEFCGDIDRLSDCMGAALIAEQCSKEAISLKDKLVRLLIRGSLRCDKSAYTVSSQNTTSSQFQNGRRSGNQGRDGTNTVNSNYLPNRTLISLLVVFIILLGFS
ncbi:uncharacterized protein LOC125656998 isoform X1 [Ostrea edulis]|uniref:uncharacterized protein LOC125656998 isoform X1 n=2 Tax=Ostrea edulis TaxID=37623 RepID=UPI00209514A5|nr:uncharacterized protein LOC125656998 isoform X1 [Ostrea edulis]